MGNLTASKTHKPIREPTIRVPVEQLHKHFIAINKILLAIIHIKDTMHKKNLIPTANKT
jgi:hypothetical protein